MSLLALDLATTTGWAFYDKDSKLRSGSVSFKPSRFAGGGWRFLQFERWLAGFISTYAPDEVVFEEVRRHLGVDAGHIYGGFVAILTKTCEDKMIPYRAIGVGTIKKHATGSGAAKKPAMIAAAEAKWPDQDISDDNVADALWLLDCALTQQ
jgi:Holliday junction resolvasome RuvABC endonuclease subunit